MGSQMLRISRGSVTRPRTALAAAVSGLASSVRAPGPWRPSKLRLLVLIEYSPLPTTSPFMPKHIEQPDSRHSAPASMKTRSRPSASAAFLTCCEPGTTSAPTGAAMACPPLGAGLEEDAVEALSLGRLLDLLRAGYHQCTHAVRDLAPAQHLRSAAQVGEPPIDRKSVV